MSRGGPGLLSEDCISQNGKAKIANHAKACRIMLTHFIFPVPFFTQAKYSLYLKIFPDLQTLRQNEDYRLPNCAREMNILRFCKSIRKIQENDACCKHGN